MTSQIQAKLSSHVKVRPWATVETRRNRGNALRSTGPRTPEGQSTELPEWSSLSLLVRSASLAGREPERAFEAPRAIGGTSSNPKGRPKRSWCRSWFQICGASDATTASSRQSCLARRGFKPISQRRLRQVHRVGSSRNRTVTFPFDPRQELREAPGLRASESLAGTFRDNADLLGLSRMRRRS